MFSFFLKKKQSPDTPQEEPVPDNNSDDFIFVEKKGKDDPTSQNLPHPVYPPMPSAFNQTPYPTLPYLPQKSQSNTINQSVVPYVQDVPFVLAPQLRIKNTSDVTQTQVDGILALLTRQMSVNDMYDYDFALERSIRNECY